MGFAGRLEGIAPSDIFQMISQNRMTGTLVARCPDGTAMVVFKEGQVIEAASDEPRESLAHLLVSQGLMTEKTVRDAQERLMQTPGRPLGELLVEMGAISGKTLERVVLKQIGIIVQRLVSCEDGFITFDRGETALKRKLNTNEYRVPKGISAQYLIMDRARRIDEERRSGADRRRACASPLPVDEPAEEIIRPSGEPTRSGPGAAGREIAAWFREKALPMAMQAAGAALDLARKAMVTAWTAAARETRTAARKGMQTAGNARELFRDRAMPWLRKASAKAFAFSPDGRALIRVGSGALASGVLLVLATMLVFRGGDTMLVVTRPIANIRANPSSTSMVIEKAEKGEKISQVSSARGWYKVRTASGKSGWVWQDLVEQKKGAGQAVNYGMMGFQLTVISAGVALLAAGIRRKHRAAPAEAGALRNSRRR